MVTLSEIDELQPYCSPYGLEILGALHPSPNDFSKCKTLALLGPCAEFWDIFQKSTQATDNKPDPIDRWSLHVISDIAKQVRGQAFFPFGEPFAPFINWAKQSGRAWNSPVGMLVHDTMGLMISYRGAIGFREKLSIPPPTQSKPCIHCTNRPCLTICPVSAFENGYNASACHEYLNSNAGRECMEKACAIRRICPSSVAVKRKPAHNRLHMQAFKGTL